MSRKQVCVSLIALSVVLVVLTRFLTPDSAVSLAGARVTEPVASTHVVCPEAKVRPGKDLTIVTGVVAPIQPPTKGPTNSASPTNSLSSGASASASPEPSTAASTDPVKPGRAVLVAQPPNKSNSGASSSIGLVGGSAELGATRGTLSPILGTASGSFAPGFAVTQWTYHTAGSTRGLAALACTSPTTDQWFVGGGSGVGRTTTITLVNDEDGAAQVVVEVYGPRGRVIAPAGEGVLLAPHGRTALRLTALAPGLRTAAVHIRTTSGRVVAAVLDQESRGVNSKGLEWIPGTLPSRHVVIPGGDGSATNKILSVVATGSTDANVKINVITSDGRFVPAGHETLDAAVGHVVSADLTAATAGQVFGIELTSDQPIVAGLRAYASTRTASTDTEISTGIPPLVDAGVSVGLTTDPTYRHSLLVTAPGAKASLKIQVIAADGSSSRSQIVAIPAGTTAVIALRRPTIVGRFSVLVTPLAGGGPVYAASYTYAALGLGPIVTVVPLMSLRTVVTVPDARPDLGVAFVTD